MNWWCCDDDDTYMYVNMMMRYPDEPMTYQCASRCFESTIAEE
jgi:hypothetical protein